MCHSGTSLTVSVKVRTPHNQTILSSESDGRHGGSTTRQAKIGVVGITGDESDDEGKNPPVKMLQTAQCLGKVLKTCTALETFDCVMGMEIAPKDICVCLIAVENVMRNMQFTRQDRTVPSNVQWEQTDLCTTPVGVDGLPVGTVMMTISVKTCCDSGNGRQSVLCSVMRRVVLCVARNH